MGIRERKEKQKDALKREILGAARELFVAHGYHSVSMRKVAEKIEYSPTTIYLYFKDKRALLFSICEETFAALHATLKDIQSHSKSPLPSLRKGMRAYIDFGLAHPSDYTVVFMMSPDQFGPEEKEPWDYEGSAGQGAFQQLVQMVVACIESGELKKGDPATISQTIWSGLHGITSLFITHRDFPFVDREKLINTVINTLISGLQN